tara:strand:- start:18580 stop:20244 length:1665 start_codon:yes stop_codon:yes gene_type:complete
MALKKDVDPNLFNRRHPTYDGLRAHWDFVESTYHGGRAWFGTNVFKYVREGDNEFADRKKRAYRFNHTREVVDLVTKYVFKSDIHRSPDAPGSVKNFWRKATRGGESIDTLMRQVDKSVSIFGQPYIVVDSTVKENESGKKLTVAEIKNQNARIYAYVARPQDVLDVSYDMHGEINWILLHETGREDGDFFATDHDEYGLYRLWTRTHSFLYKVRIPTASEIGKDIVIKPVGQTLHRFKPSASSASETAKKMVVDEMEAIEHGLGVVPVFPIRDRESDSQYHAPALIDDIAYLDRANANYLSNLDAIIQDQTFSTLTIPVQSLESGSDMYSKVIELGTKRVFAWDAEGGEGPKYISPDPSQAGLILSVITKIITEIYHSIGMAGERTKMDSGAGIDNSSGVAKSYDFDRMNTMLKSKADRLAHAENKIAELVMLWSGESRPKRSKKEDENGEHDPLVKYSDDFDTRGLYDDFDVANRLTLLGAPDELRRYQFSKLVDKLFPSLKKELREAIEKELTEWPIQEEVDVTNTKTSLKSQAKPEAENKQGQGTKTSAK